MLTAVFSILEVRGRVTLHLKLQEENGVLQTCVCLIALNH